MGTFLLGVDFRRGVSIDDYSTPGHCLRNNFLTLNSLDSPGPQWSTLLVHKRGGGALEFPRFGRDQVAIPPGKAAVDVFVDA